MEDRLVTTPSLRLGLTTTGDAASLDRVARLGLTAWEWVRFDTSPAGPGAADWRPHAEMIGALCQARGLRLSAIAAWYRNPLDPRQTGPARAAFLRALEVAAFLGVRTVAGFSGAVVETVVDERGGHPVYQPFENYLPQMLAFWEPLAQAAAERGLRIAFENCPQGRHRLPVMNYNWMGQPALWERFFDATRCPNLGLEWDPSHLVCQLIDPVKNLRKFASRVFHVHAKDAWINRPLLEQYGICHPGVSEHRFPGLGQVDWREIMRVLTASGYDSDLTIEGFHDPVYRDHPAQPEGPLAGRRLEDQGVLIAKRNLEALL